MQNPTLTISVHSQQLLQLFSYHYIVNSILKAVCDGPEHLSLQKITQLANWRPSSAFFVNEVRATLERPGNNSSLSNIKTTKFLKLQADNDKPPPVNTAPEETPLHREGEVNRKNWSNATLLWEPSFQSEVTPCHNTSPWGEVCIVVSTLQIDSITTGQQ